MLSSERRFAVGATICALGAILNLVLIVAIPHYTVIGSNLVSNGDFSNGLDDWTISAGVTTEDGRAVLKRGDSIKQVFPKPATGLVFVSTETQLQNVQQGDRAGANARVHINGRTADGVWQWGGNKILFAEQGTRPQENRAGFLSIPKSFVEVMVEAEVAGPDGNFLVDRIDVFEAQPVGWVWFLLYILALIWIGTSIVALSVARRRGVARPAIFLVALLLFPNLDSLIIHFLAYFSDSLSQGVSGFRDLLSAMIHVVVFAGLALLCRKSEIRTGSVVIILALVAIVTEEIQFLLPGRELEVQDMVSDVLGSLVGLVLWRYRARIRLITQSFGLN